MTDKVESKPLAESSKPTTTGASQIGQFVISQTEVLDPNPKNPIADVIQTWYSNYGFVTAGGRDLWIDFLQLPGTPVEGRTHIPTYRIFLTHVAAQKLAEQILSVVRDAISAERIEKLST